MKQFFYQQHHETDLRNMAGLGDKTQEGLKNSIFQEGKKCSDSENIVKLKALYDLADDINDHRYDECLTFYGNKDSEQNLGRSKEFIELLRASDPYTRRRENPVEFVLANVAAGNSCVYLSHCFWNEFQYEDAKKYSEKGRLHFWDAFHACQGEESEEFLIYKLLIHLNFAMYYREWAGLTQRRNYEFALRELECVFEELRANKSGTGVWAKQGEKRQMALIYIEAMIDKGRIYLLKYALEDAEKYLLMIVKCLLDHAENYGMKKKEIEKMKALLSKEKAKNGNWENENLEKELAEYSSCLCDPDRKTYFMSAVIQLSIVLIKQRKYPEAQDLLDFMRECDQNNRDMGNNRGICFRKRKMLPEAVEEFLANVCVGQMCKNIEGTGVNTPVQKLNDFFIREVSKYKPKSLERNKQGRGSCIAGRVDRPERIVLCTARHDRFKSPSPACKVLFASISL